MLLNLRQVLDTDSGKHVFKYFLKHYEVGQFPEEGLDGIMLAEVLGKLRAGNAMFKLLSEANHGVAGSLLAILEKERYEELYAPPQDESDNG